MSTNQNQSVLNESFPEQRLLDIFLRSTKLIKIIEEKTDQFINKYNSSKKPEDARAPIILNLPLHYRDLVEKSQDLLHNLVEEPLQFLETAKYQIYSTINSILKSSLNSPLKTIDSHQVHIQIRFIGLPVQEDLIYDIIPNRYPGGLAVLNCVLAAYTEPENYTIQSIWYCTTGCQTNLIKQEVTKEPNCYNCARPMSEYSKLRCVGTYRLLKVFSIRSVSTPVVFNKIFRSQIVRLDDYVYDCELKLGAKYTITGHLDFKTIDFIAWNLVKQ